MTTATVPADVRRGRTLVPIVRDLLAAQGLSVRDLELVACGVGPGSFTGIRIGIATAATLAYAAGVPVAAIGSLHGRARNAPDDAERVCVCLDARRGNVYSACFVRRDGALVLDGEYAHGPRPDYGAGTLVLGDDAPVRPDEIARLGIAGTDRRRPEELRPLYMRLSDPEIRKNG